jgi:predicted PurR-regulated permease PerM
VTKEIFVGMAEQQRDLTRTTLAVLFIGGLIIASLWVIEPFLAAVVWAATLVVATWPLLLRVQAALGQSRGLAVAVMTLAIVLIFMVPFWLAISTILTHADDLIAMAKSVATLRVPPAPAWVHDVPLVGQKIAERWDHLEDTGIYELAPQLTPYAGRLTQWFINAMGSLGLLFVEFLLTVVLTAIMYAKGERAAEMVERFGHRLAGARGQQAVVLVGRAIRGVALGVVVTALVQSSIGGIGLVVVGVPLAALLTSLMFMLCVVQIGPAPVLVPAVVWMFAYGSSGWASVLLACSILAISLDNFLRPILIRKGADLPMLLVLAGVIGGLIAFGLLGVFLGPAVLAVSYTLLQAWMAEDTAMPPMTQSRVAPDAVSGAPHALAQRHPMEYAPDVPQVAGRREHS